MVIQYPHTLTATIVSDAHQDENGNWVPGASYTRQIECRAEVKSPSIGGAGLISTSDGRMVAYSMVVYMPRGTDPLQEGVSVSINCMPPVTGNVLSFSKGQLNSRLWL
jgi:hypothetical protein